MFAVPNVGTQNGLFGNRAAVTVYCSDLFATGVYCFTLATTRHTN